MRPGRRALLEHLPLALFCLASAVLLIGLGMAIERYRFFPRSILNDATKTATVTLDATLDALDPAPGFTFLGFSDTPLEDIPARRIEFVEGGAPSNALLLSGGHNQYHDLCPDPGCAAVAIAPSGEVVHVWPFRANAILDANIVDEDEYPYELNGFSAERDTSIVGVEQYSNGDLLVTFHRDGYSAFPYGGGVARIGRDGRPRWYRRAYNHHWPRLVDGDIAFVPAYTIADAPESARIRYNCDGKHYRSAVDVIDGDGILLERIPLLDILLASGRDLFRAPLHRPCDPLHLNAIDIVGESADGAHGILPGDLVLSLRDISAFAILDAETRELKHLVRGTFHRQHDVTHLAGTTFLMLDNEGGWKEDPLPVSRLLMIDIATGFETTVFPNDRTPDSLRGLHIRVGGSLAISPDRTRAIVSFEGLGLAVEVRLSDGEVLNTVRSLHDVSGLDLFPAERHERAAQFQLSTVDYLRDAAWPDS